MLDCAGTKPRCFKGFAFSHVSTEIYSTTKNSSPKRDPCPSGATYDVSHQISSVYRLGSRWRVPVHVLRAPSPGRVCRADAPPHIPHMLSSDRAFRPFCPSIAPMSSLVRRLVDRKRLHSYYEPYSRRRSCTQGTPWGACLSRRRLSRFALT